LKISILLYPDDSVITLTIKRRFAAPRWVMKAPLSFTMEPLVRAVSIWK